jgi:hypothetical protein
MFTSHTTTVPLIAVCYMDEWLVFLFHIQEAQGLTFGIKTGYTD